MSMTKLGVIQMGAQHFRRPDVAAKKAIIWVVLDLFPGMYLVSNSDQQIFSSMLQSPPTRMRKIALTKERD